MDELDQIEEIRAANNRCWIDLLRLALEVAPERAKRILTEIEQHDQQIHKLLKELANSD